MRCVENWIPSGPLQRSSRNHYSGMANGAPLLKQQPSFFLCFVERALGISLLREERHGSEEEHKQDPERCVFH
jgi:hypothetical protein